MGHKREVNFLTLLRRHAQWKRNIPEYTTSLINIRRYRHQQSISHADIFISWLIHKSGPLTKTSGGQQGTKEERAST